jgi:uncharacterized protein (UPF0212 family)
MAYLKPAELLALQQVVSETEVQSVNLTVVDMSDLEDGMDVCPVCGSRSGCEKTIVKANGVYVHLEDALDADEIERPGA